MTEKATAQADQPQSERAEGFWKRLHTRLHRNPVLALVTKVVVGIVGMILLVAGIIMIVTPGPALVLIPLGLAVLSTEFAWARKALEKVRDKAVQAKEKAAAQDPRVRRRNRLISVTVFLVVAGAATWYLVTYDWPAVAVDGWDWVQGMAGWVPDLPGM